jgi:hypothetical protein
MRVFYSWAGARSDLNKGPKKILRAFLFLAVPLPSIEVVLIAADVGKNLMLYLMIEVADRSARNAEVIIAAGRVVVMPALSAPHLAVASFLRPFPYDCFSFRGFHDQTSLSCFYYNTGSDTTMTVIMPRSLSDRASCRIISVS